MKNLFVILSLSLIIATACNDTANNNSENEESFTDNNMTESVEDKAIKAITDLPEYYEAAVHVKAMTNGEQSLSSIIEAPNEEFSDYYIQVGYNQERWFEALYHFYVNPETFQVSIEDVIAGDIVSIETWRKREENR